MNIVTGLVYFEEYASMSIVHLAAFGSGVLVTLVGLALLSRRGVAIEEMNTPLPIVVPDEHTHISMNLL